METNLDFRSDTVTKPTPEMREAMAKAVVGDDVYGEDPTVNKLQEMAANITRMEAAIFVPSGTMGNLASILSHCQRGDEIIVGDRAHIFLYEATGAAALGGVNIHTIPNNPDGTLSLEHISAAIRPDDPHQPITRLVTLENTHNRCDGISLSPGYIESVSAFVHSRGLKLHIDGARIFNASVDQNVPVSSFSKHADSITFCLSKGLSAPVGSLICGSNEFIDKVHRVRKQLGGGMRQAGILAAAGIVAIGTMVDRLKDDHFNARQLAQGISNIPFIVTDPANQHTNMVYFNLDSSSPYSPTRFQQVLEEFGLLIGGGPERFRMVTHAGIDNLSIQRAIEIIRHTLESII